MAQTTIPGDYDQIIDFLNTEAQLIYVPSKKVSDDGISFNEPDYKYPLDTYNQICDIIRDYEYENIECAEAVSFVDVEKDGGYFDANSCNAVVVLNKETVAALIDNEGLIITDVSFEIEVDSCGYDPTFKIAFTAYHDFKNSSKE